MASASLLSYKKNFRASPVLERFYTGGALVVAGDGTFVACACVDDVKIVDLATGLTTKTLKGDSETVTAIALSSSNGKSLFVASRSLQIKHWDLTSQSCLRTWKVKKIIPYQCPSFFCIMILMGSGFRVKKHLPFLFFSIGDFCLVSFSHHTRVVVGM
jgi:U3 small nucleolar RNA-associated protein 13